MGCFPQVSNRITCMVNTFVLAGLLKLTLIASFQTHQQEHTDMDRHVFLDVDHLRSCYGENAIITAKVRRVSTENRPWSTQSRVGVNSTGVAQSK